MFNVDVEKQLYEGDRVQLNKQKKSFNPEINHIILILDIPLFFLKLY